MDYSAKYLTLRKLPLFEVLQDKQIEILSHQSQSEKYKKGEFIFSVGDQANYVYIITDGQVKVGLNTNSDKVLIKEVAYTNELLGENILPTTKVRRQFAQTITETHVLKIPVSYYKSMLEKNPELCHELAKLFINKLMGLEERMNNFVFKKAQTRIVSFLKNTALSKGIKIGIDEILINHGLSHKEIANITDTSRQTVARVLGDLKRDGIIHFSTRKPNKILIRNMMSLA